MNQALRRSAAHVFVESLDAPVLGADDLHHLARVLRLRDGEVVSTSDGAGRWRLCRHVSGGELRPDGEIVHEPEPGPPITIGFAIPKGDRPEWIVQKLTEIGVDRILLLHAAHSVVRWEPGKSARQLERLTKVAKEAAMQSRRVRLVGIAGPLAVLDVADDAPVTNQSTQPLTNRDGLLAGPPGVALAEPDGNPLDLSTPTVLIGPEGGWNTAELAGFGSPVTLGTTILRVETAALVAATLLVAARDRPGNSG